MKDSRCVAESDVREVSVEITTPKCRECGTTITDALIVPHYVDGTSVAEADARVCVEYLAIRELLAVPCGHPLVMGRDAEG